MNNSLTSMAGKAGLQARHVRTTPEPATAQRPGRSAERPLRFMSGALALAALAACGGGGDGDSVDPGDMINTPTVLTLTGTAATGAALANAAIHAKCVGGERTDSALANGSYTLVLPAGAALPCVLKATGPSGSLYSVATGSGRSARANITPVTTLAVAQMASGQADSYFAAFDPSAPAPANLVAAKAAATSAVLATLASAGVDLSAAGDVFTVPLVAGSASDVYDLALDALQEKLDQAGVSLAGLAAGIVGNVNPLLSTLSATASLPADLLSQPSAPTCASLRSGTYRSLDSEAWSGLDGFPVSEVVLDAASLTFKDGGETIALLPDSSIPCRFNTSDGAGVDPDAEVTVSGAGVMVARYLTENVNGSWHGSVLIPKQSHTLAELAGEWNLLGFDEDVGGRPFQQNVTATVSASGVISKVTTCVVSSGVCTTDATSDSVVTSDGSGAFFLNTDGTRERLFAYRAGGGELMLVMVKPTGALSFATRKVAQALPALGRVSQGWQISLQPNQAAPWFTAPAAMNPYFNTVTATDPDAHRFNRDSAVDGLAGVTRPETVEINSPLDGFARRLAATGVLRSDGVQVNVSPWVSLPLRGMGFSALSMPSNNQLWLSVGQAQ